MKHVIKMYFKLHIEEIKWYFSYNKNIQLHRCNPLMMVLHFVILFNQPLEMLS